MKKSGWYTADKVYHPDFSGLEYMSELLREWIRLDYGEYVSIGT